MRVLCGERNHLWMGRIQLVDDNDHTCGGGDDGNKKSGCWVVGRDPSKVAVPDG